eukprot:2467839-Rhodomonas_salina.1
MIGYNPGKVLENMRFCVALQFPSSPVSDAMTANGNCLSFGTRMNCVRVYNRNSYYPGTLVMLVWCCCPGIVTGTTRSQQK